MTIFVFTGTPGSGKTYHCCRTIRDTLKYRKRDVVANFEVVADENWAGNFTYMPNCEITAGNLISYAIDYWNGRDIEEDGLLLCLDEAQLIWNSRKWDDADRMSFLEFLSQHRKYGYKIIMIAQSDIMIDKQFRTLIEYQVDHRKLGNFGMFGKFMKLLMFGERFVAVTKFYSIGERLDVEYLRYRKEIGAMYNTFTTFKQLSAADAAHNLIKSPKAVIQERGSLL